MVETNNRGLWVYDIETLSNCYTYTGFNIDSKEIIQFVIHYSRNELKSLISHLKSIKGHIGYNNLAFDAQVNEFIIKNSKNWLDLDQDGAFISNKIYEYSQLIIEKMNKGGWADYPEWELCKPELDLFKIWHFDNKAKMVSLKFIEYSIDLDNIEEMPIHHSTFIITNQIQEILDYNLNDVKATYEFYKITIGETDHPLYKGIDKVQLRKDIISEFGIKCINYNDVKIGDEINKVIYSKLSNITKKELPKRGTIREKIKVSDCVNNKIEFESLELKHFYREFTSKEFNPVKLKDSKDRNKIFTFKGLEISFGFGGIHSIDKPRKIETDSEYYLTDKDCTGMYPRTIIEQKLFPKHLGENWYKGCEYIYNERSYKYKPLSKTDSKSRSFSEAFKMANNGGSFGLTNQIHSWQYDPLVTFSITIYNQFALLKFAEMLLLNNISVVSLNTDGCLSLVKYDQKDLYEKLSKEWEILSKHTLEETLYSKFIQTSVNDYIAVTTDNKIKLKGDFVSEFEIHKNKSKKIVPLALQQYLINNIPIEKTIRNHTNIFDFCLGAKSIGTNRLIHLEPIKGTEIKLQKINRYYVSTNGWHLLKRLKPLENKKITRQLDIFGVENDGTRESEIEAGWLTTIYNKHIKKDISSYNINYKYYIDCCQKIIDKIENK